jgi:hypothetical protein
MEIKTYHKIIISFFVAVFLIFLLSNQKVLAANGSVSVSPQTGSYAVGNIFSASIAINGGGTPFNAAKATILTSQTLNVTDLILGDCGFAFVKTPTISDLSFAGVLLGSSTQSCTLYSLKIKAVSPGAAYILLSDASVKSYKGALELISSVQSGNYTFNNTSSTNSISVLQISPTQAPKLDTKGIKLYDVSYSVTLPNNIPPSEVITTLDSTLPIQTTIDTSSQSNSKTLKLTFNDIPQGVHKLTSVYRNQPIADQIVTLSGNNKDLVFGASTTKENNQYLIWYALIALLLVSLLVVGIIAYKVYRNKMRGF